jgi:hypothetical protein
MATRASQYRTAEPAQLDQRRIIRLPVSVSYARVRKIGEHHEDATLCDVSIYGCRIASDLEHEVGERVWLRLADGAPIAATVMWVKAGEVGCRFETAIERATVRELVRAMA